MQLRAVAGQHRSYGELHAYLHSPDYSRAGLATRLRELERIIVRLLIFVLALLLSPSAPGRRHLTRHRLKGSTARRT